MLHHDLWTAKAKQLIMDRTKTNLRRHSSCTWPMTRPTLRCKLLQLLTLMVKESKEGWNGWERLAKRSILLGEQLIVIVIPFIPTKV